MKYTLLLILLVSISCSTPDSQDTEELEKTLMKFNEAYKKADDEALEKMLVANYRHTNSSNKAIGKDDWLSYIKTRNANIAQGKLELIDYQMDEIDIQKYGNSAFVSGRITTTTLKDSANITNQYRVTHLWVLEGNSWKRAGFHDGKIK